MLKNRFIRVGLRSGMSTNSTAFDRDGDPASEDEPGTAAGPTFEDRIEVACLGERVVVEAGGTLTSVALRRAGQVARQIDGAVRRDRARLSEAGRVESVHVARLLERAGEYHRRTEGSFDVREYRGTVRAWLDGDPDRTPAFDRPLPDGETGVAVAEVPVAFGDLALGYAVDRVAATLDRSNRPGRVDAGRLASSARGIEIRSPGGGAFGEVTSDWSVATTGTVRRGQGIDLDDGDVVVLARRDCTEAAALCSTVADRSGSPALRTASEWDGGTALLVQGGVVRTADGIEGHLE